MVHMFVAGIQTTSTNALDTATSSKYVNKY